MGAAGGGGGKSFTGFWNRSAALNSAANHTEVPNTHPYKQN
jgi:hypothetical protein